MILGATLLAQVAFGSIASGVSIDHVELAASIQIQSQIDANITVIPFELGVGISVFASYGIADSPKNLILAANNKRGTLVSAIDANDLSITVTGNISSWPSSGALTLDLATGATDTSNEIVYYDGKSGQIVTLTGRAKDGTTAKSFAAGSQVGIRPIAETHNLLARTLIDVESAVLDHDAEFDVVLAAVDVLDSKIIALEGEVDTKLPLAGGTLTGLLTLSGAPTSNFHAATKRYVDEVGVTSYNAKMYGLAGNGATNDTAALQALIDLLTPLGGGRIFFPAGVYLIGGALQETSGRNAQILLPVVATNTPAVSIEFVGAIAPPRQFYNSPPPSGTAFSIIKSTLTGASGTAAFIAGREGGGQWWDHVQLIVRDLIFEAPPNPSFTAFNCKNIMGPQFINVLIHTGSLHGMEVAEPTHANATGIKLAPGSHSAGQKTEVVDIWGFYVGLEDGELAENHLNVWECKQGILVPFTPHLSTYRHLGLLGCQRGIVAQGEHYMRVFACAIESGSVESGTSQPWQVRVYDLDDPSNLLHGDLQWVSITAAVGNDHTFYKNGGTNIHTKEIGTP